MHPERRENRLATRSTESDDRAAERVAVCTHRMPLTKNRLGVYEVMQRADTERQTRASAD